MAARLNRMTEFLTIEEVAKWLRKSRRWLEDFLRGISP
jgi:hypothetical protein